MRPWTTEVRPMQLSTACSVDPVDFAVVADLPGNVELFDGTDPKSGIPPTRHAADEYAVPVAVPDWLYLRRRTRAPPPEVTSSKYTVPVSFAVMVEGAVDGASFLRPLGQLGPGIPRSAASGCRTRPQHARRGRSRFGGLPYFPARPAGGSRRLPRLSSHGRLPPCGDSRHSAAVTPTGAGRRAPRQVRGATSGSRRAAGQPAEPAGR